MIQNSTQAQAKFLKENYAEHSVHRLVSVVIERPFPGALTYVLRSERSVDELMGSWVLVPLARSHVMGCVIGVDEEIELSLSQMKSVIAELHWVPSLPPSLVKLIKYISSYYHVAIGETIKLVMPRLILQRSDMLIEDQGARVKKTQVDTEQLSLALSYPIDQQAAEISPAILEALKVLNNDGPLSRLDLPFSMKKREWNELRTKGTLKELKLPYYPLSKEPLWSLSPLLNHQIKGRRSVAHEIVEALEQTSMTHRSLLCTLSKRDPSTVKQQLRTLLERGIIELCLTPLSSTSPSVPSSGSELTEGRGREPARSIELTTEQSLAVDFLTSLKGFSVALLHGVTGSGKTEVYLEMIDRTLAEGKQVLVLIPEIGLTPQTVSRFKRRLTCPIYTWHSKLSNPERLKTWQSLSNEGPCVLIGARSALFSPLRSLGLIIVDESHDASYKQGEGIRYHARDMAVMRASFETCLIILGTATPSLESMYNAIHQKYHLVTLKERPKGASLPKVRVVDLTKSAAVSQEATAITHVLAQAISDRLKRGEQSVLFLNRRGFSQSIRCVGCGFVFTCPFCLLPLPWHQTNAQLQCHHCDFKADRPHHCHSCQKNSLAPIGRGTERIELQLQSLFPHAQISRLDQDSKLNAQELHDLMHSKSIDILIGTQMVTKGHDFPMVTLVGVIDADVGVDLPDFRANERSFQLLSQVAGRAGRAELPGEVIIQSYRPKDERLLAAISHDYMRYFAYELRLRETISYPPFGHLATIRLRGEPGDALTAALETLQELMQNVPSSVRVRGPSLAPIKLNRGSQRWLTILSSPQRQELHHILNALSKPLYQLRSNGIYCFIDVDPHDFF